jgi:CRP/FNR family cyclic AMP-dependent transcriptional regulator
MAEDERSSHTYEAQLAAVESLGPGTQFTEAVFGLVGRSQFFAEFTREDTGLMAGYMAVYRAQPRQTIIREGDLGDYMLMIIQGEIDIYKKNLLGESQLLTSVGPGMTLGEMSMIDGEPRFATCVAVRETLFGVLSRDSMVKIILERPSLGAKILIKLVTMLSHRLRQTSTNLLQYMRK